MNEPSVPEPLRAACHDAIARALLEAGVKNDVLQGMCFEVGLEAFTDAFVAQQRAETPPEPTDAQIDAIYAKHWPRTKPTPALRAAARECAALATPPERAETPQASPEPHRNHDKIVAMAGDVAAAFDEHMGYGAWTDSAYRQDAATWKAAWEASRRAQQVDAMVDVATKRFDAAMASSQASPEPSDPTLLPCPFCGSHPILEDSRTIWIVRCQCNACVLGERALEPDGSEPESYWERIPTDRDRCLEPPRPSQGSTAAIPIEQEDRTTSRGFSRSARGAVVTNEEKVASVFPETWTHHANVNWLGIGYQLKLMNAWPQGMELARVLATCEKLKLLLRDGDLFKRGNNPTILVPPDQARRLPPGAGKQE